MKQCKGFTLVQLAAVRRGNHAAFTLVELLVVIGIIVVLIGLLMPALVKARQQAQVIQCQSNLRQLGQALAGYTSDNSGYIPAEFIGYKIPPTQWNVQPGADVLLLPYLSANEAYLKYQKVSQTYYDPSAAGSGDRSSQINTTDTANPHGIPVMVYRCPTDDRCNADDSTAAGAAVQDLCSYGVNGYLDTTAQNAALGFFNGQISLWKTTMIPHPDKKVFMCDMEIPGYNNDAVPHWNYSWYEYFSTNTVGSAGTHRFEDGAHSSHPQVGRNAVFLDGHCEWFSKGTDLWPYYDFYRVP